MSKNIALCMIVKNESAVILRCLESVRPLVDYVLVEDTGSTDGTQAVIRAWLERVALPGEVYDEPWRDFGYNRSHALERLRQHQNVDYALMLDADDHLVLSHQFDVAAFKNSLTLDSYDVQLRSGPARYLRPQICSNRVGFQFRGVLHEFLSGPESQEGRGTVKDLHIESTREGARNRDPRKYHNDAMILESALRTERDPFLRSRYTFYLARSYDNAGERDQALKYFLERATLGYWTEEVFMSLYAAGYLRRSLGEPVDTVISTFLEASDVAPIRAEALHAASRLCREEKRFEEGYEYARRGVAISLPPDGLFVVTWIYEYGLLDELAVNAFWCGRYLECLEACDRLLHGDNIPNDMRDRVAKNAKFATEQLQKAANAEFIFALLKPERLTTVVDIGANPIDSDPPYKELLAQGRCRVVGFEPQETALASLNARKGERESYLPDVIGDGKDGVLYICRSSGMASLYAPNVETLEYFDGFRELGEVKSELKLQTRRLDDIPEIGVMDFLRMDVQGAELSIIKNGRDRLKDAVAVQAEVSFVTLYKDQPTFGEIDVELREQGFLPHCFVEIKKKLIAPLPPKYQHEGINQLLEADLLYVRDFTQPSKMTAEQLKQLAVVAHFCYASFDLAANCIGRLVDIGAVQANALQQYIEMLEQAGLR